MIKREKFKERKVELRTETQKQTVVSILNNLPLDDVNPIECIFREKVIIRKPSQNSLMWTGPLADIAEQAYYQGRRYSDVLWHETFKRLYLPEEFDHELCKEGYRKWDFDRDGVRVLVGSTTELTVKGFSIYLEQVIADGANMGVMYHANPNEWRSRE